MLLLYMYNYCIINYMFRHSNIEYMRTFHFCQVTGDDLTFCVATYEAAIAYIERAYNQHNLLDEVTT